MQSGLDGGGIGAGAGAILPGLLADYLIPIPNAASIFGCAPCHHRRPLTGPLQNHDYRERDGRSDGVGAVATC